MPICNKIKLESQKEQNYEKDEEENADGWMLEVVDDQKDHSGRNQHSSTYLQPRRIFVEYIDILGWNIGTR